MQLSLGPVTIHFGKNGKYVKREECNGIHKDFENYLDRKLSELTIDRNQKLIELKADLIEHINLKIDIFKK